MPATASPWTSNAASARALASGFSGTVDSAAPGQGLHDLAIAGLSCPSLSILGIATDSLAVGAQTLVDWHARGPDQVACYESTEGKAVRVDIVWSVASGLRDERVLAQVDLLVSARTNVLDWHPDLFVQSKLPVDQAYGVADIANGRFEPLGFGETAIAVDSPACFWHRPSGASWSYVEMIHPADVRCSRWSEVSGDRQHGQLQHHLFRPESLERGVILRARARGLFLTNDVEPAAIAKLYTTFVAADPELSTR